MKQILRTALKVLLLLTLLALGLLLLFGLMMWIGWPWWVGFFVLIGLLGLTLGVVAARKVWARRREQMFVHQVIAQDEDMYKRMAPKEQDAAKELRARWTEAIDALRKSHLRKSGNPLYVLPWYMVIGESGSGKTTAIQSARLSSPFADMSRTSGISGTRNCDWWFFEQAIIIDTAGRYALPVDQGRDKAEWQDFLTLLAKYRKKEPLNGLVVTLAADRLNQATPEALQEDGRNIRKRIEEVTRVLGARSPVYVMVTKCDLIQGATQFCDLMPENALNQAMGFLNRESSADAAGVIEKAVRTVGDRLRDLRLILLHRAKERGEAAGMLLFPEELEKLQEGLSAFATSTFQQNPYQETPLLRGIFFSSGRQEGTPFSHFLSALGLIQEREVLRGTNRGLFLHDFFAKILPADRYLFKPTQHMQEWRTLTRNLGLTAWIAFMVAVCGLLSYTFIKNLNAMSDVRREFQKPALLQGELLADIITMDRFRESVLQVEEQNRNWWVPRLWLDDSIDVEKGLKQKYVALFQNGFMQGFDKTLGDRLTTFGAGVPSGEFGAHVALLVRRINLLKARLAQEDLARLGAHPQPAYDSSVLGRSEVIPEVQKKLAVAYLYAVAWDQDSSRLNNELTALQTLLKHLLTLPGIKLDWLADWVSSDPALSMVTLADFWGGQAGIDSPSIPAAFTRAGKAKMDTAMAEIESALFDPLIIGSAKLAFAKWYDQRYFEAWQKFAQSFENGGSQLKDKEQWQIVAKRLPTDKGPFIGLIRRIEEEFRTFNPEAAVPSWVGLVYNWEEVRQEARNTSPADLENPGLIQKATSKVSSKIKSAERALGVKVRVSMEPAAQLNAAKAMHAYQTALDATVKATESRKVAFEMASALYQQDPATGESPFLKAQRALDDLKAIMADRQDDSEALFWALIDGNLHFMQQYVSREAACHLQTLWKDNVLTELQDVSTDRDIAQIMMGSDGLATQFIKGPAGPFIGRSLAKGYYAKETLGLAVPMNTDFMAYLSQSAQAARPTKSSYSVQIRAYPTDANRDAQLQPHSTVLELQCANGSTRLENLNYPVSKTFVWSPGNCGDVTFQIAVGNLLLTRRYTGQHAFAKFLHDFKTGQYTFSRNDFPSDEAALNRMGIKYIKAKYQFQGQNEVLSLLYSAPGSPPRKIAACWD
ncbi:MAG: type VI secretion system protein ImpL [Desulfobacteraceae bacterium]|nr:MAG: type VI secretion system protein ImpL [Desulfobacteraceae bacterium]